VRTFVDGRRRETQIGEPRQIERIAEAEAKAAKIHALSRIEVVEIERRAMRRFVAEETKKQRNIESIAAKALPEINPEAQPENMEEDWIAAFLDNCRLVSSEEMQTL